MSTATAIKKPAPVPGPTEPFKSKRMALGAVTRGKQVKPDRVLLFGVEGIGKSTWAANAPSPIFIPVEDGTANLDVARFPEPSGWMDVMDAIQTLTVDAHEYKTVAIDTLDALEAMCWKHICERDQQSSIEAYGYGKGYVAALDQWRTLIAALEKLQRDRGIGVVLIAHSWIKTFKNPEGEDYDRYELKLNAKAAGLFREWSEDVLFARYETFAEPDKKGNVKGISSGARVIHTQRTAAWDAKNRHSLPEQLPLDYEAYAEAVKKLQPADPEKLRAEIKTKLALVTDKAVAEKVEKAMATAGDDAIQLARIDNKLTVLTKGA